MLLLLKKLIRALRNFVIALKQEYVFAVPGGNAKVLLSGRDFVYDKNPYREIFFEGIYSGADYKDAVVLDIGAHKGYFSVYALLNGAKKLYAFEPDLFNFKFLEKNVARNGFYGKALMYNNAVGSKTGQRNFFVMRSSASHSLVERRDREMVGHRVVQAVSINDVLREVTQDRERIILKLDVEGGEYEIIPAIEDKYFLMINKFFVEYHAVHSLTHPPSPLSYTKRGGAHEDAQVVFLADVHRMNDYILSKGFTLAREISDREFLFSRI